MLNDKVYIVNLHSSTNFTIFLSLMRTIILNNEGVFAIHKATLHETLNFYVFFLLVFNYHFLMV